MSIKCLLITTLLKFGLIWIMNAQSLLCTHWFGCTQTNGCRHSILETHIPYPHLYLGEKQQYYTISKREGPLHTWTLHLVYVLGPYMCVEFLCSIIMLNLRVAKLEPNLCMILVYGGHVLDASRSSVCPSMQWPTWLGQGIYESCKFACKWLLLNRICCTTRMHMH